MPSGLRKTTGNHFEIYYEEPWGGVASDKGPVDIAENQCVTIDGVTVRNGLLCATDITAKNSIYNLNTLNPPTEPPYSYSDSGGIFEIALVSIIPTDYDVRTGVYNGRIYTVASTASLQATNTIGIIGTVNSVGDYDFNGSDVIDVIIDSTTFHTATPYLSDYNGPPADVTGGFVTTYYVNSINSYGAVLQVQGGGSVIITAGTGATYDTAITLPTGYTYSNMMAWATAGAGWDRGIQVGGVYNSTVTTAGLPESNFATRAMTEGFQSKTNWIAVFWTSDANVFQATDTATGKISYLYFTTINGDNICFALGANLQNGTVVTIPTAAALTLADSTQTAVPSVYSAAQSIYIPGLSGMNSTGQGMQGVDHNLVYVVGTTLVVGCQYGDNVGGFWDGFSNVFVVFYNGAGITTTAMPDGNALSIVTSAGQTVCLFTTSLGSTASLTVPSGYDATTLFASCAMSTFSPSGDYVAHGWPACDMSGVTYTGTYQDGEGHQWAGSGRIFGVVGLIPTPTPPAPFDFASIAFVALIFNVGNYLCCVDQLGFSYIAEQNTDGTVSWYVDQTATNAPTQNFGVPTAVKVIDGIAYISVYSTNTLYAYTPGVSYIIATQYAAGKYIEIFDEYLLQLNTNSANKDTSDGEQPTRINWSSPDEFSVWDPAVNRTAGYQSLTSAAYEITGFVAMDNVGYIFRRNGVTQITATGVAIQPFNFTTYWNSVVGQGLIFPSTLKQFGRIVFLTTDTAVYVFAAGQFSPISTHATAAIYKTLEGQSTINANTNLNIAAGLTIYPLNDNIPILYYLLINTYSNVDPNIVFWFYNTVDKCWTALSKNLLQILSDYLGITVTSVIINFIRTSDIFLNYAVSAYYSNIPNYAINAILINVTYTTSPIGESAGSSATRSFVLYDIVNTPTSTSNFTPALSGNLNLVFRAEEIKLGFTRKCTIRRAVIKAYGTGTLAVNITDLAGIVTSLGTIVLDGTNNQRTYYTPYGMATVEAPQLSITSTNFNGAIVKVMLAGTYADAGINHTGSYLHVPKNGLRSSRGHHEPTTRWG